MASIVATPEPGFSPPRVRLDVAATAGTTLSAVEVRRDGKLLRQAVFPGGTSATVYDYEAPYGVAASYAAVGTTAGAFTNEWSESWANLTNWTGDTASWSVSGGKASATVPGKVLERATTASVYRMTVAAPESIYIELLNGSGTVVAKVETLDAFGSSRLWVGNSNVSSGAVGGQAYTLVVGGGNITVNGTSGGWTLSLPFSGDIRRVRIGSLFYVSGSSVARVGAVAVAPNSTTVPYSVSTTTTLNADSAWLVHPVQPSGRSVCIGKNEWRPDGVNISPESMASASRGSNAVLLQPVGRTGAVVISEGARPRCAWSLVLLTHRLEDLAAVNALLDDEQVLLLRSPAAWTWGHPDGWWAVGETSEERPAGHVLAPDREITLPLSPAEEPVVMQQPAWSYGDVVTNYATYADVVSAFATYSDLLVGPQ